MGEPLPLSLLIGLVAFPQPKQGRLLDAAKLFTSAMLIKPQGLAKNHAQFLRVAQLDLTP